MITPHQIRAGRALIDAKQEDFARRAGLSLATLNNIERGIAHPREKTLNAIKRTFEREGVVFQNTQDGFGIQFLTHSRSALNNQDDILQYVIQEIKSGAVNPLTECVLCFSEAPVPHIFVWLQYGIRDVIFDSGYFSVENIKQSQQLAGLIMVLLQGKIAVNIIKSAVNVQGLPTVEALEYLKTTDIEQISSIKDILAVFPNIAKALAEAKDIENHLLIRLIKEFS